MTDRRIHATLGLHARIVRYDRAGKWYYERYDWNHDVAERRRLTLDEAVHLVADPREVRFGVPGGSAFDRKVRARFEEASR